MSIRSYLDASRERLISWSSKASSALHRARTQQVDFSRLKDQCVSVLAQIRQSAGQKPQFSFKDLRPWLQQHGRKLALFAGAPLIGIAALIMINLQITRLSGQLALKPAQLTAIEALIQDSKSTGLNHDVAPALTDNDLETMRVILQNRGITTNILRLNLEQGVSIDIQAEQVTFGQWVAFLEEIARRWQVYPVQLTLQASDQPETVSVRGSLQQSLGTTP